MLTNEKGTILRSHLIKTENYRKIPTQNSSNWTKNGFSKLILIFDVIIVADIVLKSSRKPFGYTT